VGSRAALDAVVKRKIPSPARNRTKAVSSIGDSHAQIMPLNSLHHKRVYPELSAQRLSYFATDNQSVSHFVLAFSSSGVHDQILAVDRQLQDDVTERFL
jgi:hypothetical protein